MDCVRLLVHVVRWEKIQIMEVLYLIIIHKQQEWRHQFREMIANKRMLSNNKNECYLKRTIFFPVTDKRHVRHASRNKNKIKNFHLVWEEKV